ncbi:DUF2750 domain-containing protein [Streptomyces sp. NPDC058463]|uniref:DUF2750 domain-containing protein n=1 Tax=Streptomyces sp. NPDC058463 TaxID=3346510 RepID=UPI003651AF25
MSVGGTAVSVAMSQSGSQAAAFFRDVRQSRVVWLVRDDDGSPTHLSADGTRSLPFWSTSPRAQRAAKIWGRGIRSEFMPLDIWCDRVLPDAALDGLVIGISCRRQQMTAHPRVRKRRLPGTTRLGRRLPAQPAVRSRAAACDSWVLSWRPSVFTRSACGWRWRGDPRQGAEPGQRISVTRCSRRAAQLEFSTDTYTLSMLPPQLTQ